MVISCLRFAGISWNKIISHTISVNFALLSDGPHFFIFPLGILLLFLVHHIFNNG